jgi:hypothetical protein
LEALNHYPYSNGDLVVDTLYDNLSLILGRQANDSDPAELYLFVLQERIPMGSSPLAPEVLGLGLTYSG